MQNENVERPTTMLGRLGNVLYWAGCIFAVLGFVHGVVTAEFAGRDGTLQFLHGLFYGLPFWLLGLAARYVLTGRVK